MKLAFTLSEPDESLAVFDVNKGPDAPPLFTMECTAIDDLARALSARLGVDGNKVGFILETGTGRIFEPDGKTTICRFCKSRPAGNTVPPHHRGLCRVCSRIIS